MLCNIQIKEIQKPKSIKTVGLLIVVFSGFIIISNAMGIIAWLIIGIRDDLNSQNSEFSISLSTLFSNYIELCLIMLLIGISLLIGGVFIRKYKLWANKLVNVLSALIILIVWGLMFVFTSFEGQQDGMEMLKYVAFFIAFFWSIPMVLLVWFLNRRKIKKNFE